MKYYSDKQAQYHLYVLLVSIVLIIVIAFILAIKVQEPAGTDIKSHDETITSAPSLSYAYNIEPSEREMLARLVYLEANTESIECQKAIVSVVINRWQSGIWGDTLEDVIYYPYQFTPASMIASTTPTQTNYDAVDYVLENGSILPKYCMYFRASYGFSNTDWVNYGYNEYLQVDNTFFGYFEKDK